MYPSMNFEQLNTPKQPALKSESETFSSPPKFSSFDFAVGPHTKSKPWETTDLSVTVA